MPNEEMGQRLLPQPPDVNSRAIIGVTGGFLLFVAVSVAGLFLYLKSDAPNALKRTAERQFPQPALQKAPQIDLQKFEAEQRSVMSGYRWVDSDQGIARIPIEDAMRMIAARGEHAYEPLDGPGLPGATTQPGEAKP